MEIIEQNVVYVLCCVYFCSRGEEEKPALYKTQPTPYHHRAWVTHSYLEVPINFWDGTIALVITITDQPKGELICVFLRVLNEFSSLNI